MILPFVFSTDYLVLFHVLDLLSVVESVIITFLNVLHLTMYANIFAQNIQAFFSLPLEQYASLALEELIC